MSANELLTSTEAAAIASVGVSTIKRWADQGTIPYVRTVGGHRRFERSSVERLLRELASASGQRRGLAQTSPSALAEAHGVEQEAAGGADLDPAGRALTWRVVLERAQRYELDARLLEARSRLGRWCDVADEVAGGLRELGLAWDRGELSIAEEHIASDALGRALARVGDTIPTLPDGPRVLLACAPSDEHTLGLSLAELCTREVGATPVWLGRHTPVEELLRELSAPRVRVMVIAASAASSDADALRGLATTLGEACHAAGVRLVLGGAGAWPEALPHTSRVHSFRAYRDALVQALARPSGDTL